MIILSPKPFSVKLRLSVGSLFCIPHCAAIFEVGDVDRVAENVSIRTSRLSPGYQQSCVIAESPAGGQILRWIL